MKLALKLMSFFLFFTITINAQGFNVKAKGEQKFSFKDEKGRNQATFFSTTPLEDVAGTVNNIKGEITFTVSNFAGSLGGKIIVMVESMKTGIDLRDQHLRSANWLDSEEYPEITFEIKDVVNAKSLSENKIECKVNGEFTLHGITKNITAEVTATYLDESEKTKERAPGDLLGVSAEFKVKLSDYEVENNVIGNRVAEDIQVKVNIVGSNKI